MQFDRGYISAYFVTNPDRMEAVLEAPARQIADNAGAPGEVVISEIRKAKIGHGYDALAGEYGDMFKKGIVDAAKVTRSALQNAPPSQRWF